MKTVTGPVYDANGNITQKSDVGNVFKYNHPTKPYALTGIETTTALVPQVLQEVSYTSFEQPSVITESPYQAAFLYNSDEQRARMEVKQNGSTILTRWYAGSRYMKETATWIGGDAYTAPCVAVKTNTCSQVYYYLLRDYLGNITHQVNMSNTVVAEYSFDSWGRRRDKDDWTYNLVGEPELFAGRGFTGHEWLPWFNLYNMNGRLYDLVVGRFLSPDNYVQMPDNTQNFNRYSYALNNPLKYTDPDGEFIFTLLAAIIPGAQPLLPFAVAADIGWMTDYAMQVGMNYANRQDGWTGKDICLPAVHRTLTIEGPQVSKGLKEQQILPENFPIFYLTPEGLQPFRVLVCYSHSDEQERLSNSICFVEETFVFWQCLSHPNL